MFCGQDMRKSSMKKLLRWLTTPFFEDVSRSRLKKLAYALQKVTLRRNEVLYRQGEQAESLYFVAKGCINIVMDVVPTTEGIFGENSQRTKKEGGSTALDRNGRGVTSATAANANPEEGAGEFLDPEDIDEEKVAVRRNIPSWRNKQADWRVCRSPLGPQGLKHVRAFPAQLGALPMMTTTEWERERPVIPHITVDVGIVGPGDVIGEERMVDPAAVRTILRGEGTGIRGESAVAVEDCVLYKCHPFEFLRNIPRKNIQDLQEWWAAREAERRRRALRSVSSLSKTVRRASAAECGMRIAGLYRHHIRGLADQPLKQEKSKRKAALKQVLQKTYGMVLSPRFGRAEDEEWQQKKRYRHRHIGVSGEAPVPPPADSDLSFLCRSSPPPTLHKVSFSRAGRISARAITRGSSATSSKGEVTKSNRRSMLAGASKVKTTGLHCLPPLEGKPVLRDALSEGSSEEDYGGSDAGSVSPASDAEDGGRLGSGYSRGKRPGWDSERALSEDWAELVPEMDDDCSLDLAVRPSSRESWHSGSEGGVSGGECRPRSACDHTSPSHQSSRSSRTGSGGIKGHPGSSRKTSSKSHKVRRRSKNSRKSEDEEGEGMYHKRPMTAPPMLRSPPRMPPGVKPPPPELHVDSLCSIVPSADVSPARRGRVEAGEGARDAMSPVVASDQAKGDGIEPRPAVQVSGDGDGCDNPVADENGEKKSCEGGEPGAHDRGGSDVEGLSSAGEPHGCGLGSGGDGGSGGGSDGVDNEAGIAVAHVVSGEDDSAQEGGSGENGGGGGGDCTTDAAVDDERGQVNRGAEGSSAIDGGVGTGTGSSEENGGAVERGIDADQIQREGLRGDEPPAPAAVESSSAGVPVPDGGATTDKEAHSKEESKGGERSSGDAVPGSQPLEDSKSPSISQLEREAIAENQLRALEHSARASSPPNVRPVSPSWRGQRLHRGTQNGERETVHSPTQSSWAEPWGSSARRPNTAPEYGTPKGKRPHSSKRHDRSKDVGTLAGLKATQAPRPKGARQSQGLSKRSPVVSGADKFSNSPSQRMRDPRVPELSLRDAPAASLTRTVCAVPTVSTPKTPKRLKSARFALFPGEDQNAPAQDRPAQDRPRTTTPTERTRGDASVADSDTTSVSSSVPIYNENGEIVPKAYRGCASRYFDRCIRKGVRLGEWQVCQAGRRVKQVESTPIRPTYFPSEFDVEGVPRVRTPSSIGSHSPAVLTPFQKYHRNRQFIDQQRDLQRGLLRGNFWHIAYDE
eukprot:Rmarinus@m.17046